MSWSWSLQQRRNFRSVSLLSFFPPLILLFMERTLEKYRMKYLPVKTKNQFHAELMTGPPPSSTLISMQVGVARQSWSDSPLGFFNPWNSTECSISSEDNVLLTLLLKNKTTSDIVGLFFDSFPFYVSSFPPTKKQRNNGREPKEEGRVKRKKKGHRERKSRPSRWLSRVRSRPSPRHELNDPK